MDFQKGMLSTFISGGILQNEKKCHNTEYKIRFEPIPENISPRTTIDSDTNTASTKYKKKKHFAKKKPNSSECKQDNIESTIASDEMNESFLPSDADAPLKDTVSEELEKLKRTIFIKNLPVNIKKSKIKKLFQIYGSVENVRFRCVPLADPRVPKKVALIKRKFHPNRTNICAFVCFSTEESAEKALAASNQEIGDHHIIVDKAIPSKEQHNHNLSVFIGNLSYDAEEEDLWKLFEQCGSITDIRIPRDRSTEVSKGFAYVNFESPASVELALKLDGESIKDRQIRITRCSNKVKQKIKSRPNNDFSESSDRSLSKEHNRSAYERRKAEKEKQQNRLNFEGRKVGETSKPQLKKKKKKTKVSRLEMKRRYAVNQLASLYKK